MMVRVPITPLVPYIIIWCISFADFLTFASAAVAVDFAPRALVVVVVRPWIVVFVY
jgi:hypothetical protein